MFNNSWSLYGAGERTGVLNVEGKLAKVLEKDSGRLVIKASERDSILDQISARAARYRDLDPETYDELMQLRKDVRDIFNKGLSPGDDIMDQLYFLDPKTRDFVEKLSRQYTSVVTPDDFKQIASIMSEYMGEEVPILKDFTRFFGRLAQDFVQTAKPSSAAFDWKTIAGETVRGSRYMGKKLPRPLALALGLNPDRPFKEEILKRFDWYNPNSTWSDLLFGMRKADFRRTGAKKSYLEFEYPTLKFNNLGVTTGGESVKTFEWSFGTTGNLPKDWTQIPWVNFDGKIIEQKFTQSFEERLRYRAADGSWVTNIVQVSQKTDPSWWEEVLDKNGKINEIVDATKARTSYPVSANHSNDATLVKRFHLWGSKNNITTSTINKCRG